GLEIHTSVSAAARGYVLGDPDRVRQILLNLLGNAVKFTDTGSVRLTVKAMGDEPGPRRYTVTVSDTGIGVPEDRQRELFQRFSQIDRGRGGT
ncbi:ATP-binding protein, partial [Burkholderia sp. SIMBA_057]